MKHIFIIVIILLLCINTKAQIITTIAGNGIAGFSGDGGLAIAAQLNNPSDVFKDGSGNIYIADRGNNRIRKVNSSGFISTIAGNGMAGYAGDGGPAVSASLNNPNRVVIDGAGNIYIADYGNQAIRKIGASDIISTIAGTGIAGFFGDGGLAISAQLSCPTAVAVDLSGNVYIADSGNFRIRKINTYGIISTYAGGGLDRFIDTVDGVPATALSLCGQNYVSVDNSGTIFITNRDCYHFLKVTPDGLAYNVAGFKTDTFSGDCGLANAANIEGPFGICPDNIGNVYLCPQQNIRVRRVNPLKYITTVAGTGIAGYSGDGGPAIKAEVSSLLHGIYADTTGNVYFADMGNNVIRTFFEPPNTFIIPCPGATITLSDSIGNGTWSSSNTAIATVDAQTGMVKGMAPGTVMIIFLSTGCPEVFSVTVGRCDDIIIHDVITPNNDGINDVWVIEGISDYPKNAVQLFDKWGNKVYEKSGYNNDWTGRESNGALLPDGTYFYLVNLHAPNTFGGKSIFTGSVLIER